MKRKIWVVGVLTLLLTLVLSGCFVKTVDELYTLPKHSDEYNDLQNAIDGLMAQGAAYSAPVSGANQQSVQLADLDGDGQDEAIVFLKTGGDKPLGAYIFDLIDGAYQNIAVIEGGTMTKDLAGLWEGETPANAVDSREFLKAIAAELDKRL